MPNDTETMTFEEWCDQIAKLLGLSSIDGDYEKDGYSLDEARGLFENREPPQNVAYFFRIRMQEIRKRRET